MSVPHQAGPPEPAREPHGHMVRRRALTLLIIVLLIGVPAGYLVISAAQSRASGKDKEDKYAATGLTWGWPSKVQRRIYQVPVPHPADLVASYETNNWKTSRLYVQFMTTDAGLDAFLGSLGASRSDLRENDNPISERDRNVAGWHFAATGPWWGLTGKQKDPAPTRNVVVNLANPDYPTVYVVSTTTP